MKVVIVGGGVMGMLQARSLAHCGWNVSIVEQGELGREASWAGGGIISPLYPWRYNDAVTALASRSQQLYPQLVHEIEQESGLDPEYSPHGLLMLKVQDEDSATSWAKEHASWMEEIDADRLYELEPHLREGFTRSLWMPSVASIRNPRLLNALRHIMHHHERISVYEHDGVTRFDDCSVTLLSGLRVEADVVVFCSGAWTSRLLPSYDMKIEPVKGQMLVFDAPKGLLNRVVLSDGRYVIPRRDGKVVAGSTLEYEGFNTQTTQQAKQSLRESAVSLLPALSGCEILHHWAGLRPGSPDGVPVISKLPDFGNVYVNAGHFRNGLVLAPASVELLTQMLVKGTSKLDPTPYQCRISSRQG